MRRFLLKALGVLPLLGNPPPNAKAWAGVLHKLLLSVQPAKFAREIVAVGTMKDPNLFIDRMLVSTSQSLKLPPDAADATSTAACGGFSAAPALDPFFEVPPLLSCDRLRPCSRD